MSRQRGQRRVSGEGTIFQRRDGRWVGRLSFGSDDAGRRLQKTVYGVTQREAFEKLETLRNDRRRVGKSILNRESLAAFLESWLENHVEILRAGKTVREYRGVVRRHIQPQLGDTSLVKIDSERIFQWQAQLAHAGRSANVRRRALRVLQIAMNHAIKLRKMVVNPCAAVEAPMHCRKQVTPLEPNQCFRLFENCQQHRLGDLIIVAALTGLRKGELFALHWSDVDLDGGVINIRHTLEELPSGIRLKKPKSTSGRRVVAMTADAVRAFRHRKEKAVAEGLAQENCPIVFPNRHGGYLRSSNFDRSVWKPLRTRSDLPESFVFHDLRHTTASLLLAAGVDLKVIQHQLGHSDYSITANTYSHLLPNARSTAASKLGQFLRRSSVESYDVSVRAE